MSDLDGLVPWLHEQLNAREKLARAALDSEFLTSGRWSANGPYGEADGFGLIQSDQNEQIIDADLPWPVAQHIADNDPARTLAEITAVRDVIHLAERARDFEATFLSGFSARMDDALRLFAVACADRPGYKETWRP